MTFNKKYFLLAVILFILEVIIALFVKDRFIRPYLGDFLVVILMYCSFRSFLLISTYTAVLAVLFISFTIEFLQFINIQDLLNLNHSSPAGIAIGNHFDWMDILAYILGMIFVIWLEESGKLLKGNLTS